MTNACGRTNYLVKIKTNEPWHSQEDEIKKRVVQAFQNMLTKLGNGRPRINGLTFEGLGDEATTKLEELFWWKRFFVLF